MNGRSATKALKAERIQEAYVRYLCFPAYPSSLDRFDCFFICFLPSSIDIYKLK